MAVVDRFSDELIRSGKIRISVKYEGPKTPEALIVICHGVCEHCGRYRRFVSRCCEANIACISFDFQGHGASSGLRGHVVRFEDYLEDLRRVTKYRDALVEMIGFRGKSFLLGHSMGGVVVARYLQDQGSYQDYSGAILSSPGLATAVSIPVFKRVVAKTVRVFLPTLRLRTGIDESAITSDVVEQQVYATDPQVTSKVSLQWFAEFERSGVVALRRASELSLPLYVFYGSEDRVVSIQAIEQFVEAVGTQDKMLRCFQGLRHETLSERPDAREEVVSSIVSWVKARL